LECLGKERDGKANIFRQATELLANAKARFALLKPTGRPFPQFGDRIADLSSCQIGSDCREPQTYIPYDRPLIRVVTSRLRFQRM
jgi:hypothetical protein